MRVGLVLAGDIDGGSGGFYYDRRLRDRLRDHDHEVSVVSLPWRSYPRRLVDNLRGRDIASRLTGFDVVVEDGLAHPSLLAANRRVTAPVVGLMHMIATQARKGLARSGVERIERWFLGGIDAIIYNGHTTRRDAQALGAPDHDVVAPPAGDRFSPETSPAAIRDRATERPLEITFLGNVVERKGLDTLVDGLAGLDADWRLTVVGDTDVEPAYVDRTRTAAADAGIAGRVRFTGRLDDEAVAARLRDTHVLAVPSRYEPFGMVYLEAMGFGCVPLATTAGGAHEFVRDGDSGFLVPPECPEAVTDCLRKLGDGERLAEMAVAARREYEAWPTWTESMDRAVGFLETVTS